MPRILIIGKSSFIGTNFKRFSSYKYYIDEISLIENKPEAIDFSKYDVVLHLAAIVHQSKRMPENQYFEINRDLCLKVAELAAKAGVKQFVFLSTLKVYGSSDSKPILRDETDECKPADAYGKSKYEAEIGLRKLENKDFTVSVLRCPVVYGDGVKGNIKKLLRLIECCPILPFGKINNRRNFIYTENLVGFIDRIIELKASGTFVVKDEGALSTTELVYHLAKNFGKKIIMFKLPGIFLRIIDYFAPNYVESLFYSMNFNNEKTKEALGYTPEITSKEGIRRMIEDYKEKNRN
ncbi:MAG TPA: NAD-dependent epimerase/dehydratase family protein [Bacteroidales bacterium]|nr:NAD-dependent epimerase/dehydratase family protein [Bacteroidales bacterium]HCI56300.1 hypothetical protein [Bacteroidales bacterium]HOU95077.1 NAD-dependent epimerase/dehydratase family protein [Bacteroidales bacterium]HQG36433.1 NAD-dependent epimerase/dehydratase family protein [Bacteroidales bacterium]HQG53661.1 NAD-dependent epimerase/dehydratase family protein [Bacteroidales bacterium]